MKDLKIAIIYGSYRPNRKGIRAARFALNQLKDKCETVFLDAKEIGLPMLATMYKEYEKGEAPENMNNASKELKKADGFIFVCGEYNHALQPGLKNFIDHFQKEYFFKPAAILTYSAGSFGGVRAGIQARITLGELGMVTISTIMPVPKISDALNEAGESDDERMIKRFERFSGELFWYAEALKDARKNGVPF